MKQQPKLSNKSIHIPFLYLAKVVSVKDAKLDDNDHVKAQAELKLDAYNDNKGSFTLKSDDDFEYEKDDMVLVIKNNDVAKSVVLGLADEEVTKITAEGTDGYKINGEWVKAADKFEDNEGVTLGTTYKLYYDQYENLIGVFENEETSSYYVLDSYWYAVDGSNGGRTYYVNAVDFDGNIEKLVVDKDNSYAKANDDTFKGIVQGVVDEDDEYTFTTTTNAASEKTSVSFEQGKKTLNYNSGYDVLTEETTFVISHSVPTKI